MAQVINTNMMSLMAQNNLNKSQNALSNSIQRLSTGYRINSAKDDAAGQGIANRFTAQIRGLTQAARNANDGLSLTQTIEGGVNQINDNLQRMRELTVQALNSTNTKNDLSSIYREIIKRVEEIDRITEQVDFNGVKVLKGTTKTLDFQVGANDNEKVSINLVTTKVDDDNMKLAKWNDSNNKEFFVLDNTPNKADDFLSKFARTFSKIYAVSGDANTANIGQDIGDPAHLANAEDYDGKDLLKSLDNTLNAIDSYRGQLGATQNRFEAIVTELSGRVNNLTASRSRIEDADYATEVSNMTRAQILQQAGTSVLSQANQVPQTILSLLQG